MTTRSSIWLHPVVSAYTYGQLGLAWHLEVHALAHDSEDFSTATSAQRHASAATSHSCPRASKYESIIRPAQPIGPVCTCAISFFSMYISIYKSIYFPTANKIQNNTHGLQVPILIFTIRSDLNTALNSRILIGQIFS